MARSILVVEPDDEHDATWRFGRVTRTDAPLAGEIGRLERRAGRRSTEGRAKGGGGEKLAGRAERLRARRLPS